MRATRWIAPPVHIAKGCRAEYDVDRIVNWRERGGIAEFEVKWAGYTDDENTWESHTNVTRSSGKTLFRNFVSGISDEHLRQLLPMTYGGTGEPQGRRRRRAE